MSDEDKTNNPYQPPAPSDEPLAKQDADTPKAKLNPVHWLVPIFGYAYVPAIFIFDYLVVYNRSQEQSGFAGTLFDIEKPLKVLIGIALPVYVVVILFFGWRRHKQGTNTRGIKLYNQLSLILALLYVSFFLCLSKLITGRWTV